MRILGALEDRTASPKQLADEMSASLGVVSYHVRMLAHMGLVKLVDTKQRRGAIEHYYRAEARPVVTSEAWAEFPTIAKQAMVRATLNQVGEHVNAAAQSGGFERAEAHLTRSPMVLDERGWREVATRLDRLLKELERIAEAAEKRLTAKDHEGEIRATAVLMLFESPAPRSQDGKATAAAPKRGRTARRRS